MLIAGSKSESRVVRGRSFKEDQRHPAALQFLEPAADQSTSDTSPLAFRQHPHRAEHLDIDESVRGVEQVTSKEDVSDNGVVVDGHQGEPRFYGER